MALEIERKFLPISDAWRAETAKSIRIRQGYLPTRPGCSVRVRLADAEGILTVKGPTRGCARTEYEYAIPADEAQAMLAQFCAGREIDKIRHLVPHGGRLWEVDEFAGDNAGLVVAEIELIADDEVFLRPPWLGAEVTDNPAYRNQALVANPYQNWKSPSC